MGRIGRWYLCRWVSPRGSTVYFAGRFRTAGMYGQYFEVRSGERYWVADDDVICRIPTPSDDHSDATFNHDAEI